MEVYAMCALLYAKFGCVQELPNFKFLQKSLVFAPQENFAWRSTPYNMKFPVDGEEI